MVRTASATLSHRNLAFCRANKPAHREFSIQPGCSRGRQRSNEVNRRRTDQRTDCFASPRRNSLQAASEGAIIAAGAAAGGLGRWPESRYPRWMGRWRERRGWWTLLHRGAGGTGLILGGGRERRPGFGSLECQNVILEGTLLASGLSTHCAAYRTGVGVSRVTALRSRCVTRRRSRTT